MIFTSRRSSSGALSLVRWFSRHDDLLLFIISVIMAQLVVSRSEYSCRYLTNRGGSPQHHTTLSNGVLS